MHGGRPGLRTGRGGQGQSGACLRGLVSVGIEVCSVVCGVKVGCVCWGGGGEDRDRQVRACLRAS